jgi:hypothetical protein
MAPANALRESLIERLVYLCQSRAAASNRRGALGTDERS